MSKNYAIIVAAGKGKRMRADINKQFLNIKDKPVIYYTLKAFADSKAIDGIIIVCAENEIEYCKNEIVERYQINKVLKIVSGGRERQNSVYNGINAIDNCEIVLIHDGARPFVNNRMIEDGIKYAREYGACACGVVPKDTIEIRDIKGFCKSTLNRNELFLVQTPQCFRYDLILECYNKLNNDMVNVTDDTAVVKHYGKSVFLYEGSYDNIKITTPEDLYIAERIIEKIK